MQAPRNRETADWELTEKLKVDDALALDVPRALRGFGLSIDEASLALRAGAFGRLAGAADQSDISHGSVVAQMAGDGEVVHGTDRDFLAHVCGSAPHLSWSPIYYAPRNF